MNPGGKTSQLSPPPAGQDWYANLLWIEGRKCLLVVHSDTLFSTFVPDIRASDLRPIGPFAIQAITAELQRQGLPPDTLGKLDPDHVELAKTVDRSVVGCMTDMAFLIERNVAAADGLENLDVIDLHRRLNKNIYGARDYLSPLELIDRRTSSEDGIGP
jgi:hypothetical protein